MKLSTYTYYKLILLSFTDGLNLFNVLMSGSSDQILKELLVETRSNNASVRSLLERVSVLEERATSNESVERRPTKRKEQPNNVSKDLNSTSKSSSTATATKKIKLVSSGSYPPITPGVKKLSSVLKTKTVSLTKPSASQPVPGSSSGQTASPGNARNQHVIPNLTISESSANPFLDQPDDFETSGDETDFERMTNNSIPDLDQILNEELSDSKSEDESDEDVIPILDSETAPTWKPSDKVLKWYTQVADIELKDEQISEISDKFSPPAEIDVHFQPPQLPKALWQKCKSSSLEFQRQRTLWKIQQSSSLAIKPLLSVLETLESGDPKRKDIAASIQLICSSNLKMSRYRRNLSGHNIRKDIRANLFATPVSHLNLFGTEFETAADNALKSQAATQKIIYNAKPAKKSNFNNSSANKDTVDPSPPRPPPPPPRATDSKQPFRNYNSGRSSGRNSGSQRGRSNKKY